MAAAINQVGPRQAPSMGKSATATASDSSPEFAFCFDDALRVSSESDGDASFESVAETTTDTTHRAKRLSPKHRTMDGALNPGDGSVQAAAALLVAQAAQTQTAEPTASSTAGSPPAEAASGFQLDRARTTGERNGDVGSTLDDAFGAKVPEPELPPSVGQAVANATFGKGEVPQQDFPAHPNGRISEAIAHASSAVPPPASSVSSLLLKTTVEPPSPVIASEYALTGNSAPRSGGTMRELLHRLITKSDSADVGIAEAEPATATGSAFPLAGSIPGVAGMLRLEREFTDSDSAGVDTPTSPSYGGPSLHLQDARTASPPAVASIPTAVTNPQWAEAFGSAVVRFAATDIGEAKLTLSPDEMGTISVTIGIDGSLVSVGFATDNQVVRDAVTASLPILQDMLAKSGLSLSQSSVGREQSSGTPSPQSFRNANGAKHNASIDPVAAAPARHRPAADALVDTFA